MSKEVKKGHSIDRDQGHNVHKAVFFSAGLALIIMVLLSCQPGHDEIVRKENTSPKYGDKNFVELEKAYSIDVTRISLFSKEVSPRWTRVIDFDDNDNIYILDRYECTITVFDKQGEWVRTLGGEGQGPKEFLRPETLVVNQKKLVVFQGFYEYKTMSLEGEYISMDNIHIENRLKQDAIGDVFYVLRGKTDPTFSKLEFILSVFDAGFSNGRDVWNREYSPGLQGPNYEFCWPDWLHISNSGEFYFPENNLTRYSLIKYNREGRPKIIFGREYHIEKYSREAEERFYSLYAKYVDEGAMTFPVSPPVVRKMFQDQRKNLWVISGETYEDNRNPDYENTIDIFTRDGEWLSSFESKAISRYCLYNNGKIYRILPINPDTFNQVIDVFDIRYLN